MTSPLLLLLLGVSLSWAEVRIYDLRASGLDVDADTTSPPDAFVKVFCGSASLGRTAIKNDEYSPRWSDEFTYSEAQEDDVLRLEAIDSDWLFDDPLGVCEVWMKVGTHQHSCSLGSGTLNYTYTLHAPSQH